MPAARTARFVRGTVDPPVEAASGSDYVAVFASRAEERLTARAASSPYQ
jgi:hypothetical protein